MLLNSTHVNDIRGRNDFINWILNRGLGHVARCRLLKVGLDEFCRVFDRDPVLAKRIIVPQKIGVIVTCKGRLEQVRKTMPRILHDRIVYILVDYDSHDNPWSYMASLGVDNVFCLHVAHKSIFCKGDAINRGIQLGLRLGLQKILLLDADTVVHDMSKVVCFIEEQVQPGKFGIVSLDNGMDPRDLTGILAFHMHDFMRMQSYPILQGWGGEDILARILLAVKSKADPIDIPHEWFRAIRHPDALRSKYYQEKNISLSDARNTASVYRTAIDLFHEYGYRDIGRLMFHGKQFCENLSIEN